MRFYPVFSGMSIDRQPAKSPFDLHCGRCVHLSRTGDGRRMYCSYHDRDVEIRLGDVCAQYRERDERAEEGGVGNAEQFSQDLEIDESETLAGRTGPFYALYADGEKQGWYCSTCQGREVAADPMGRLKCSRCGNVHWSHRWDLAYL